ncbi:MAG: site-specific integrase [Oligoflexia bacterium]|nr:site-specific integrase [Oligoflexia bacterium]
MSVTKRIRKRKGKRISVYRAEIWAKGARLKGKTFDTKAEAYRWHDEMKDKVLKLHDPKKVFAKELLFSECLEKYFEWSKKRNRKATVQAYEARLPYFQEGVLAKHKIRDIDAEIIDLWLDWLIEHPTASHKWRKSFTHELKTLSVILNWYRNYIDASFVVQITKRHREKAKYKRIQSRRPDYFVRPDDVRNWIDWLKRYKNPVYWELATFMILTGCRVGEATALHWDCVDLKMRLVRISRTIFWDHWTRKPELQDTTKTDESTRSIVLPEILIELLDRKLKEEGGTGPVFKNQNGELLKYNAIQSAFNAGFKALKLPWRSTHICRHTYATIALSATRDLSSVQASLGHKSRDITEKYAKAIALLSSGTAEKTAAVFDLALKESDEKNRNRVQNRVQLISQKKSPEDSGRS